MSTAERAKATKVALLAACKNHVAQRVNNAQQAIASASEAISDDTKSSAGDKFETTREMMQQELNRHHQLLAEAKRMEMALDNLDVGGASGSVRPGSLVTTNHGLFFIAVSVGQLQIDGISYWAISPASPLGQKLAGLKVGQQVPFNGMIYQISHIT